MLQKKIVLYYSALTIECVNENTLHWIPCVLRSGEKQNAFDVLDFSYETIQDNLKRNNTRIMLKIFFI